MRRRHRGPPVLERWPRQHSGGVCSTNHKCDGGNFVGRRWCSSGGLAWVVIALTHLRIDVCGTYHTPVMDTEPENITFGTFKLPKLEIRFWYVFSYFPVLQPNQVSASSGNFRYPSKRHLWYFSVFQTMVSGVGPWLDLVRSAVQDYIDIFAYT